MRILVRLHLLDRLRRKQVKLLDHLAHVEVVVTDPRLPLSRRRVLDDRRSIEAPSLVQTHTLDLAAIVARAHPLDDLLGMQTDIVWPRRRDVLAVNKMVPLERRCLSAMILDLASGERFEQRAIPMRTLRNAPLDV